MHGVLYAVLADVDSMWIGVAGHNLVLREFGFVLRGSPALRDLLQDPADDLLTDSEWSHRFIHAMKVFMSW